MKNKKLIIILSLCIAILTASAIHKTFENDTFFTIPTGNYILQHGVDEVEPFTWHENLKFTKLRWGFDVLVASIYNVSGFTGLYIFVIIMSVLIGITIFITLVKRKNNPIVAFLVALLTVMCIKECLKCRGQIMSYLFFALEIYSIQMLLETGKKRYSVYLVIISFLILTFHSSVWLAHFIFYIPYFVEWFLNKIKVHSVVQETGKIELEQRDGKVIKQLFITMLIVILTGFCTPLKLSPFTYMFKVIGGYSSKIILELRKQRIADRNELLIIVVIVTGILSITKTKIKFTDACLVVGLMIMSTLAVRNMFIALVVLASPVCSMITSFIKEYNKEEMFNKAAAFMNKSVAVLIIIFLWGVVFSINNYKQVCAEKYVDENGYPVEAAEYIKNNIDMSKMRLYNHFNFGSYLEFKGIPTFMDSRSEIYCEEFNDVQILKDFASFDLNLQMKADEMVEKYGITHFIFMANNANVVLMRNNQNYKEIYNDGKFVIFEVVQKQEDTENPEQAENIEQTTTPEQVQEQTQEQVQEQVLEQVQN